MKSSTEEKPQTLQVRSETQISPLVEQSKDLVSTLIEGVNDITKVVELEQSLTIQTILESSPISMQIRHHGRAKVAQVLDLQLVRLAQMMNVKHNLTGSMITTIVYDLLEKFPQETLEDFLLVFKRMRQGYYGPSYHLLSEATIIECMGLHLEEKWSEKERQLAKEKQKEMEEEKYILSEEQVREAYKKHMTEQPSIDKSLRKKPEEDSEYYNWRAQFLLKRKQQQDVNQTQNPTETAERGGVDQVSSGNESSTEGNPV